MLDNLLAPPMSSFTESSMANTRIYIDLSEQALALAQTRASQCGLSLSALGAELLCTPAATHTPSSSTADPQGSKDTSPTLSAPGPTPVSATAVILRDLAEGRISLMEATGLLGVQDAGHALRMLAKAGFSLPRLPAHIAREQASKAFEALQSCLLPSKTNG